MCLFLWQASFFPALVQGSDNSSENPINGSVKIVVQRGETLWDLARSHRTTVDEIVKLNKVKNPDQIREGESLWITNQVVEEKPKKIEEINVSDSSRAMTTANEAVDNTVNNAANNTANSSWWVNVLRRRIVQESTIKTYEIFVNKETPDPPEPHLIKSIPVDIDAVQKQTALITASTGVKNQSQVLSRSLGRLVSQEEVELLARVIHGEARGEKFEGQVAVGAVVLNRLKDPRFPKTIRAVIYQAGAFTAVTDKQIKLSPNDQAYKAAEAALAGQDSTNGALFYFNARIATDDWIKTRPVSMLIGNHTFAH